MKNPTFWLSASALTAGTALAAANFDATLAGWSPLVSLWGRGDAKQAVRSLEQVTRAYDAVLHRSEIDEPTQKFIDDAFDQLEDFDLDGFHDLLPDERAGYRQLTVQGELAGKQYKVGRAALGSKYEVGVKSPRKNLADMSILIRSKEHDRRGEHDSYLIGGRVGFGIGPLSYRALMDSWTEALRLTATADPRAGATEHPTPSSGAVAGVKAQHSGLTDEDVAVLALMYDAFPSLSKTLSGVFQVEDVRVYQPSASYQHITGRMRIVTERLEESYPALAKHLRKLNEIAAADARWVDSQGRTIVKLHADSEDLRFSFECYVKDGRFLPFSKDQVFQDQPIDPMSSDAIGRTRMLADARFEMLGVIVLLDGVRFDMTYEPAETYASFDARFNTVPGVRIEGMALGIMPTGLVDLFIPGNMEGLAREFLSVAAKGNGGKGVRAHVEVGSEKQDAPGAFNASLDVEALDNFLVKMAVGIVNNRVLPNDKAIEEQRQLLTELHDAFVRDLARFGTKFGG